MMEWRTARGERAARLLHDRETYEDAEAFARRGGDGNRARERSRALFDSRVGPCRGAQGLSLNISHR